TSITSSGPTSWRCSPKSEVDTSLMPPYRSAAALCAHRDGERARMNTAETRRLSRRQMLRGAALVLGSIPGAAILAACGGGGAPAAPAAATTAPAAAAAPTAAPQAATKPAATGQRITIR